MLTKEQRRRLDRLAMDYGRAARLFVAGKTDAAHMANAFGALQDYLDSITVPEGWKLVPVEPTEAILDVLYDNGIDEHDEYLRNVYRAMLAAAPKLGDSNE